ncbi:MAG: aminotransferase class V-fold PLP-dependent enzyme [SAR202 cluster bacterium]|jgi:selenocysteine lyase/cysteine desulfurase|nr:aminotransferase class V-fold PLP-dependent enzyme [SAR202 cluster bacterium]MDP6301430.1 aminotransferase class V-fold PLP-dependent enzyme [SAR202 cluster bacterium]MDP7104940.1 aminotransferase class V-fold PLP-dependent enzyme [SAR202 cluster bacterium]MDP7226893.1 aminotransferase class V-fold PLP-dependent enzyme [SAR202 cluster bacterium]MDP7413032.1 aminotransferase class V-fold PLP-dependent enzyme [SAR202 cluster bacterium]|tara:strand:+ start:2138 stop:3574 length:1437 start_codon:yes stop_codon:yes gene_type:complete
MSSTPHHSGRSPDQPAAYPAFRRTYPAFDSTLTLDDLRAAEFSRLDEQNHVYLDYTGGGLYANSQLREHMALLESGVYGNPHSGNPTSEATTDLVDSARESVLRYFNASPDEYDVAFTSNATGAIKLVGEAYPFGPGSHYALTFDNHNSINGVREFARRKGAEVSYVPVVPPELRIDADKLTAQLDSIDPATNNLLAYPAQSNFSGVQHPLEIIEQAQSKGWDVLLDAAAFVPTNRLDLSRWRPDFVPLSFYKMFGHPTGVGCLLTRKSALAKLQRPWFAGGTITVSSVQGERFQLADEETAFEDGTVNYLNIPAVEIGLNHIESIGIETIHNRVGSLTGWLIDSLTELRHANGEPLVRIYGPADTNARGGTVTVNFYDSDGKLIDHRGIEKLAGEHDISLRTGCFCNPGAGEVAHGLTEEDMAKAFASNERMTYDQFLNALEQQDGKSAGAVRISLGMVTNFADVHRFIQFARTLLS